MIKELLHTLLVFFVKLNGDILSDIARLSAKVAITKVSNSWNHIKFIIDLRVDSRGYDLNLSEKNLI
jgi:hypothetical protein